MKIRPGQAEKNEKSEFSLFKTIDNSWKDEKMRALALRRNVAEKPRGDEVEVCTFPVTHVYTWK